MNNAFYKRETFLSIKRYKLMSLKMFVLCFICALIITFTFSFGMSLKHDMDVKSSPKLMGSIPKQKKEIMMSDYYLEKFGINKENIIGKNISI